MKKTLSVTLALILLFLLSSCGAGKFIAIDYEDAESFEADLNKGYDLTGKTVTFVVKDFKPDSAFGYNLISGEHLNFCSSKNPGKGIGDTVTVRVKEVRSFMKSYIIYYDMLSNTGNTKNNTNTDSSDKTEKVTEDLKEDLITEIPNDSETNLGDLSDNNGNLSADSETDLGDLSDNNDDNSADKEETNYIETSEAFDASKYETYNYTDIARKPDDYKGKYVTFSGKVIQVSEFTLFGVTSATYRINEDGDSNKTWYVSYVRTDSSEDRVLDNDTVTVYGICNGVESYTSVLGSQITIPSISADKIELGKTVNGELIIFNPEEVIEGLNITEYSYKSSWYQYYFVDVENTSAFDIDLTINVKYYDNDNNLVGVDSMSENIQAGGKVLFYDMPDEEFATTKLDYEVKECKYIKPMQAELSYEVIKKTDKLIVTVKNNSETIARFVKAQVLFFNGDELVDYSSSYIKDSDSEIKPGKECAGEVSFYSYGKTFDNYIIFINGRE